MTYNFITKIIKYEQCVEDEFRSLRALRKKLLYITAVDLCPLPDGGRAGSCQSGCILVPIHHGNFAFLRFYKTDSCFCAFFVMVDMCDAHDRVSLQC